MLTREIKKSPLFSEHTSYVVKISLFQILESRDNTIKIPIICIILKISLKIKNAIFPSVLFF